MTKVTQEVIKELINTYKENTPIFISEIKEHFNKQEMPKVYVYLNRLIKTDQLKTYSNGIYYKGHITKEDIIEKKYIKDDNNIYGYYIKDFLVSNICNKGTSYYNKTLDIKIKRPRIKITNDNYKYLELLDKIRYNDITKEEVYIFIKENNINLGELFTYAKISKRKKSIERLYN